MSAYVAGLVSGMEKAASLRETSRSAYRKAMKMEDAAFWKSQANPSDAAAHAERSKHYRRASRIREWREKKYPDEYGRSGDAPPGPSGAKAAIVGAGVIGAGLVAHHLIKKHREKKEREKSAANLTAVIIMGNPKYVRGNRQADRFYAEIQKYLESYGFTVSMDLGMPYTRPKRANLWIGHSRGADRLQFAQAGTKTVALGSPMEGAINHPADKPDKDKAPGAEHYMLTPKMKLAIDAVVRMVGGRKTAGSSYGGQEATARNPTSGIATPVERRGGGAALGQLFVIKKPGGDPKGKPGQRPVAPYSPGKPHSRGDDTRD